MSFQIAVALQLQLEMAIERCRHLKLRLGATAISNVATVIVALPTVRRGQSVFF
jgi:hypothetical protein